MSNLEGRTAVVTGGATGIGRATALLLAEHGAKVFIGDFDPVEELLPEFEQRGIQVLRCDVRHDADVRKLIDAAVEATGRLDFAVANAGIGMVKQITDVSEEEWDAVLDTNLKGAFLLAKYAVTPMQKSGGGVIVNVSSNAGLLPRAHDPVYSTSKGSLIALTKSLALCHSRDRIRVNAVCPGPVGDTRMMQRDLDAADDPSVVERQMISASPLAAALGRMISPREVAAAILYLCSDEAQMVTGTAIAIDGGKSLGVPPK